MAMRIPWHLHHSFTMHCVPLPPLPEPKDIIIDKQKKNPSALKGAKAASTAQAKRMAKKKWDNNRNEKKGKY